MSPLARLRDTIADPNPIAVRELRSAMRTPVFVTVTSLGVLVVGLLLIAVATTLSMEGRAHASTGDVVFQLFLAASCGFAALIAPVLGASAFSGEREANTLEALVLTGATPRTLVLGKFLGAFVACAHGIVASLPLVGIAFFYGGMSPLEVLLGVGFVLTTIAPLAALGVAISSFVPSTRLAIGFSTVLSVPTYFVALGISTAISHEFAFGRTTGGREGPFGWLGALAANPTDPAIVGMLFVAPATVAMLSTWFFLVIAEWLTAPAGTVRIRPLQVFHGVAAVTITALHGLFLAVAPPHEAAGVSVAFAAVLGGVGPLAMLFFAAETPLAPSSYRPSARGLRAIVDRAFPPHAMGTTRFALVSIGLTFAITIALGRAGLAGTSNVPAAIAAWTASFVGLTSAFLVGAVLLHVIAHVGRLRRGAVGFGFGSAVLLTFLGIFLLVVVSMTISIPLFVREEHSAFARYVLGAMPFGGVYAAHWIVEHEGRFPGFFLVHVGLYGSLVVLLRVGLAVAIARTARARDEAHAALEARIRAREGSDVGGR